MPRTLGTLAHVARAAGLADDLVLVLDVAELTDRRAAVDVNLAHFARRHAHLRVLVFLGHQLRRNAGRAHELAALTGAQLDVVDHRADRNVLDRQRVADLDVGARTGFDRVADLETQRREDVALLAVAVVQQRDAARAVRIVLDRRDLRRDAVLGALEIDDAILLARAAAFVAHRDVAVVVAARMLLADLERATSRARPSRAREKSTVVMKRLPGDVGRYFFNGHVSLLLKVVHAAEFDLLARLEGDDRLFEVALLAGGARAAAREVLRLCRAR